VTASRSGQRSTLPQMCSSIDSGGKCQVPDGDRLLMLSRAPEPPGARDPTRPLGVNTTPVYTTTSPSVQWVLLDTRQREPMTPFISYFRSDASFALPPLLVSPGFKVSPTSSHYYPGRQGSSTLKSHQCAKTHHSIGIWHFSPHRQSRVTSV
jgi:hypothetical protein